MRLYNYDDIYRRKQLRESKATSSEKSNFNRALDFYKIDKSQSNVENLMEKMCVSPEICKSHKPLAINMIKAYPNKKMIDLFERYIVPVMESEDISLIDGLKSIDDLDVKAIQDQITRNMAIDRVIDNDEIINKSGKLDDFIANTLDPSFSAIKIAEFVDKLRVPLHGKVVVSIEEAFYLLDKHGVSYNYNTIIESVLGYYSTQPMSDKTRRFISYGMKDVLSEEYEFNKNLPIDIYIYGLKKDIDVKHLAELATNVCPFDFIPSTSRYLDFVENQIISGSIDKQQAILEMNTFIDSIYNCELSKDKRFKENLIGLKEAVSNKITRATSEIKNLIDHDNNAMQEAMAGYIVGLQELDKAITEAASYITSWKNRDCENAFVKFAPFISLPLFESTGLKLNLLKESISLKEYIESSTGLRPIIEKDFSNIDSYSMIDNEGCVDFTVSSYDVSLCDNKIIDHIEKLIENYNSSINLLKFRAYYTINENRMIDIHMRQDARIDLTNEEKIQWENYITEEDSLLISKLSSIAEDHSCNMDPYDVIATFEDAIDEDPDNKELFERFIECCSYANMDKSEVNFISESVCNTACEYEPQNAPLSIQMEAVSTMHDILREAKDAKALSKKLKSNATKKAKAVKDTGKSEDSKGKNPAGNSDSHPIKNALVNFDLTLRGFGKKIKDLSAKEANKARQVDAQFRHFAKSAQNAIIGDRREAVIKGQVIPSFSKCIKYAVTGGIITAINPVAGAIAIFGSIAVSKHIDRKVKLDMLDEIEVELQIVDKELQNAENRGQIKKQRALLMTKKQLQRTYQRIKLNVKLGKNVIPSGFGVPDLDNN